VAYRGHPVKPDRWDDHHILDHEIVHANEERGALDGIQLGPRLLVRVLTFIQYFNATMAKLFKWTYGQKPLYA
jgi:hypothetical protein